MFFFFLMNNFEPSLAQQKMNFSSKTVVLCEAHDHQPIGGAGATVREFDYSNIYVTEAFNKFLPYWSHTQIYACEQHQDNQNV